MYFEQLCDLFKKLPEIEALALIGSRAANTEDKFSDYDLCVYCTKVPSEKDRKEIITKTCRVLEIGNSFWELEDDCILKDNIPIDIIYRNIDDLEKIVSAVVDEHKASNGYTTCMWHSLLKSKIIFDRNGRFEKLQKKYTVDYPDELRCNIVFRNANLVSASLASYLKQIEKAITRKDPVSVCHRTAAFMESYFDIIFAINKLTHPGEKRQIEYALKFAKTLPKNFEKNIDELYKNMFTNQEKFLDILYAMLKELKPLILDIM